MATLIEEARAYEPQQMKNIADLPEVPVDLEVVEKIFKEGSEDEFKAKVATLNNDDYRVPVSVLGALKAIAEAKPDVKRVKVVRTGEGKQTKYTVIPLE